jgi:hypothetical protein
MRQRDDLAIRNERTKLIATIASAIGIAFFGLGFARPIVDDTAAITPMAAFSFVVGVVGVTCAYLVPGCLRTDEPEQKETKR